MVKITLYPPDSPPRDLVLYKERVAVGRHQQCDIIIDDPAVSAEHAVIVAEGSDAYLEDMGSTNGTRVNGQPVKKHFLRGEDVIEIARYRMVFRDGSSIGHGAQTPFAHTAELQVMNGLHAGKVSILSKMITTLGGNGAPATFIMRRPDDFYIWQPEGAAGLYVNNVPVPETGCKLEHADVIDFAETQLMFLQIGAGQK